MRTTIRRALFVMCAIALTCGLLEVARSCPFCAPESKTFSEEIASMDAVLVGRLIEVPPQPQGSTAGERLPLAKAQFAIVDVIKGERHLRGEKEVRTVFFGEGKAGDHFLLMGVGAPQLMWSSPLKLSDAARAYINQLSTLPEKGAPRLKFFQEYLESSDEMLARDAYDEFAKADYAAVKGLKPDMQHDKLLAWIKNPDIPATRRRLYLTMLGVCGSEADLPLLESLLKSDDRRAKAGLDAMIAAYLTLGGPERMPLVEQLFLKNKDAEYADTYAAIMALRFHGTEADLIPRPRILQALRLMLERPELADLVIPDLARWQDWSQVDKLVQLFKDADEKRSWVRVPVINYLRACPLPEAKRHIEDLKKIDPGAVKRANTFFPLGPAPAAGANDAGKKDAGTGGGG